MGAGCRAPHPAERFPTCDLPRCCCFDHANDHLFEMERANLEEEFEYPVDPHQALIACLVLEMYGLEPSVVGQITLIIIENQYFIFCFPRKAKSNDVLLLVIWLLTLM